MAVLLPLGVSNKYMGEDMRSSYYDKQKMANYYLISALLFLSGSWKIFILKTQDSPLQAAGGKGEDVVISIFAFLFFSAIFFVMGLRHTSGYFRGRYNKHLEH